MSHVCCPDCRLRFTAAAAAYLPACPQCGEPPQTMINPESAVGYRLLKLDDVPHSLPEAVAVSIPIPDPSKSRS